MPLTNRMKEARIQKGLTQEKLAKEIGVAKSTYTGYEKGNSEPNMLILSRIMNALDVDANFLFQDEMTSLHEANATSDEMEHLVKKYRALDEYGKEIIDTNLDIEYKRCESIKKAKEAREQAGMEVAKEIEPTIYNTPRYTLPMSAGTGEEAGQEYPGDFSLTKRPPRGTSYIAEVSGDSMEPDFHDGDLIFVYATTEIRPGQIGVFYMDGQQWIKELGHGELISHNPEYEPQPMTEDILCQGLVLGVCDESYFEETGIKKSPAVSRGEERSIL